MHNSLDRLFTGMAASLHERVLPALDDAAAAAQVRALVELLGNLSTRVTWDPAHLVETRERIRPVLRTLRDAGADHVVLSQVLDTPAPDPLDVDALHRDAIQHLEALGAGQDWLARHDVDPAVRTQVDEVVDWHLATETERLRSASFGRPRPAG